MKGAAAADATAKGRQLPEPAPAGAAAAPPRRTIHLMIEKTIELHGQAVPAGRIACAEGEAMRAIVAAGAWSCQLRRVTCTLCRRNFFYRPAQFARAPITD